jgi:hypothetical protein
MRYAFSLGFAARAASYADRRPTDRVPPKLEENPAQLSAKAAMEYKTICFGSHEMRRLVFYAANYGACGTGTLCQEIGGWSL